MLDFDLKKKGLDGIVISVLIVVLAVVFRFYHFFESELVAAVEAVMVVVAGQVLFLLEVEHVWIVIICY